MAHRRTRVPDGPSDRNPTCLARRRAFATRDGRELWKARLPASARATPLIYTTEKDGGARQMVAIAAGGHDFADLPLDTKLVVFSLGPPPRLP